MNDFDVAGLLQGPFGPSTESVATVPNLRDEVTLLQHKVASLMAHNAELELSQREVLTVLKQMDTVIREKLPEEQFLWQL